MNDEEADFSAQYKSGDYCGLKAPHYPNVYRFNRVRCPLHFELKPTADGGSYCEGKDWVDINKNLGAPKECAGNPCNVATGNKFQVERDFTVPGPGGLEFTRYYNSMGNYDEVTKTSQGTWTHTYSRRIVYSDFEHGFYSAKVYRHDGRVLQYYNVINNPSAGLNVLERLEPIMSGEQISGWRFLPGDDSVEVYDSLGRLTSITDRNGWKQTVTYDTGMKVADAFGRTITFVFSGSSLTVTDPGLNKFVYQYDSRGRSLR